IQSPSKVFIAIGAAITAGLVIGLIANKNNIKKAANQAVSTIEDTTEKSAESFDDLIENVVDDKNKAYAINVKQILKNSREDLKDFNESLQNVGSLRTSQAASSTDSRTSQAASSTDSQTSQAASDADNALSVRANGVIQSIEDLNQILEHTISAMEDFPSRVEEINKSLTSLTPLSSNKVPQLSQASNDITQSNQAVNENDINITSESSLEEIKSRANKIKKANQEFVKSTKFEIQKQTDLGKYEDVIKAYQYFESKKQEIIKEIKGLQELAKQKGAVSEDIRQIGTAKSSLTSGSKTIKSELVTSKRKFENEIIKQFEAQNNSKYSTSDVLDYIHGKEPEVNEQILQGFNQGISKINFVSKKNLRFNLHLKYLLLLVLQ
ncbi:hypothetical protein EBU91_03995, partial [bacterium]|nr:hypothetical protein [bacterium]